MERRVETTRRSFFGTAAAGLAAMLGVKARPVEAKAEAGAVVTNSSGVSGSEADEPTWVDLHDFKQVAALRLRTVNLPPGWDMYRWCPVEGKWKIYSLESPD